MSVSMESIIRPFVAVTSQPISRVAPEPPTDLEAEPPAYIEWGAASQFIMPDMTPSGPVITPDPDDPSLPDYTDIFNSFNSRIEWLEDRLNDDIEADQEFQFDEESREVEVVRIYNPVEEAEVADPALRSQWVDVERITAIKFRSGDGRSWRFTLSHED